MKRLVSLLCSLLFLALMSSPAVAADMTYKNDLYSLTVPDGYVVMDARTLRANSGETSALLSRFGLSAIDLLYQPIDNNTIYFFNTRDKFFGWLYAYLSYDSLTLDQDSYTGYEPMLYPSGIIADYVSEYVAPAKNAHGYLKGTYRRPTAGSNQYAAAYYYHDNIRTYNFSFFGDVPLPDSLDVVCASVKSFGNPPDDFVPEEPYDEFNPEFPVTESLGADFFLGFFVIILIFVFIIGLALAIGLPIYFHNKNKMRHAVYGAQQPYFVCPPAAVPPPANPFPPQDNPPRQ